MGEVDIVGEVVVGGVWFEFVGSGWDVGVEVGV